ncbi:MAG: Lrp/AsnC family transcriptional regulator [Acidimicrobiia bacterium]|nr:Lrp/AsnC family transcriptional regulator [Acidimicrobiia bacterium]NNF64830.1 Lrp/AsnC family transcriptional regulator [Acidimicrobiia bacterium]
MTIDDLDSRLILELRREPRLGMMELARRLGVARGTATARLDKLRASGVITGFGPDLGLAALGYPVTAFTTLEVTQGRTEGLLAHLSAIAEVLEVHSIAGQGDLMIRVVARSNEHLFDVLARVLAGPEIGRTSTAIALAEHIPFRTDPLVAGIAAQRLPRSS